MSAIDVLIVAQPADPHADAVQEVLAGSGTRVERISLDTLKATTFRWSPEEGCVVSAASGERQRVGSWTTVWWRRPGRAAFSEIPGEGERVMARAELGEALVGMLLAAEPRWVDRPELLALAENKLWQLARARALKIEAPETLVTNQVEGAREFASKGPPLAKAMSSGRGPAPHAQQVSDADLELIPQCPTLLQERVEAKADLRVVTVASESFTWRRERVPGAPPDWRSVDPTGCSFVRLEESPRVGAAAFRIARDLGLSISVQDWLETRCGELLFLEVNPQGQWLFLPEAKAVVPKAIAEHLRRDTSVWATAQEPGTWPSPFERFRYDLRRKRKAPAKDGLRAPRFRRPGWLDRVKPADVSRVELKLRELADAAEHRDRLVEEKASRLLTTSQALLGLSLGLSYYLLDRLAGVAIPLEFFVVFGVLLLAIVFFFLSALSASSIDRPGLYFVPSDDQLVAGVPELELQERRRLFVKWSAGKKYDTLLDARAWFSKAVLALACGAAVALALWCRLPAS